jgi:hypothetical protein
MLTIFKCGPILVLLENNEEAEVYMAAFEGFSKFLISEKEGIRNIKAGDMILGYEFYCQYPNYRGTFLSCIESFEISVDKERIPDNSVYFCLNGKQFLLSQLKDLYMEYWFILDKAKIFILNEKGLLPGFHSVSIEMKHRIPYTGYFGQYMVIDSKLTKMLAVKEFIDE